MKQILIFSLILLSLEGLAQNYQIKGSVSDGLTGEKLAGVSVRTNNNGTATDAKGAFTLTVNATNITLWFSYLGYDTLHKYIHDADFTANSCNLSVALFPSLHELKQIVVSAGRFEQNINEVTLSMEILKPNLIEATNTTKLDQALDQLPGVNLVNGQVNIRGGSGFSYGAGSRVSVLVDGLPLLSADAGDIKWDALPLENIEQVEVIKGASSALFGSGALGGVINLRTVAPGKKPITKVRIFSGIYDDPKKAAYRYWSKSPVQTGISAFHSRKIGKYEGGLGFYYLNDEGYRQGENTETVRITLNNTWRNAKVKGLNYGINVNGIFTSGGNFLFWKSADLPFIPADKTLSRIQNNKFNLDPFVQYTTKGGYKHAFRNRYFLTDNRNNTNQGSKAHLWYNEYQFQKMMQPAANIQLTFTSGISATFNIVKSDSFYGRHKGFNNALYAQLDQKFGRVSISFGARMERNKVDTIQTEYYPVFRGGANIQTGKATYLRMSLGQGYRFASVAERFAATTAGSLKIFPNPAVKPETGWSSEIGLRQGFKIQNWKGYMDIAAFWTEYYNMIEFTFGLYLPPVYDPNNTAQYLGFSAMNVTNARINGFEWSSAAEGRIFGLPLRILAGYTFIDPANKDYVKQPADTLGNEDKLKYRFSHTIKLNADLNIHKVAIGCTWRYNSYMMNIDQTLGLLINGVEQYRKDNQTGYGIVDVRLAFNAGSHHKIALIVKNILNKEYMFFPGNMGVPRTWNMQYNLSF